MREKNTYHRLGDPLGYRLEHKDQRAEDLPGPMQDDDAQNLDQVCQAGHVQEGIKQEPGIRNNDPGLGQPDFEPSSEERQKMRNVSREEMDRLRQDQEELRKQFEEKLLEFERTGIRIPKALYRLALWVMVFIAGILGLFMVTQGVRFAGQVTALPHPWYIIAVSAFLFFLGIIFLVIFKISGKFLAFKKLAKVDLKALNTLAERKKFQQLAQKKKDEAQKVLMGYLRDYNIGDPKIAVSGLGKADLEKLQSFKKSLIDKKGYADSALWLKEFEESFVYVLDKAARKRIRSFTRTVAVGTAASPIRFIDQMIVLYASLKLISELLGIYNLRPAFGQSAAILSRAIIQAYLSGVIGEQSEAGVEAFSDYYESIFGEISFATGISAATDATRFILPKMSEGALNGFLVWRLGRQAQRMLRPL
jgi:uncharacterized membrane protein YcjF (UPF0283 family)